MAAVDKGKALFTVTERPFESSTGLGENLREQHGPNRSTMITLSQALKY